MTQSFLSTPSTETAEISTSRQECQPTRHRHPLKHLLIGSPEAIRGTIHALHVLGYVEVGAWSPLMPTANESEGMSILVRYVRVQE